jgi:hypothetical protein
MARSLSCRAIGDRQQHKAPQLGANGRLKRANLTLDGLIAQSLSVENINSALQLNAQSFLGAGWQLSRHLSCQLRDKRSLSSKRKTDYSPS